MNHSSDASQHLWGNNPGEKDGKDGSIPHCTQPRGRGVGNSADLVTENEINDRPKPDKTPTRVELDVKSVKSEELHELSSCFLFRL